MLDYLIDLTAHEDMAAIAPVATVCTAWLGRCSAVTRTSSNAARSGRQPSLNILCSPNTVSRAETLITKTIGVSGLNPHEPWVAYAMHQYRPLRKPASRTRDRCSPTGTLREKSARERQGCRFPAIHARCSVQLARQSLSCGSRLIKARSMSPSSNWYRRPAHQPLCVLNPAFDLPCSSQ